jgi:hypothetical protein
MEPDFSDLGLPPLETFVGFPDLDLDFRGPDCVSLRADSIELENDVLPSTPLTEEQLGQEEELGVPINQVSILHLSAISVKYILVWLYCNFNSLFLSCSLFKIFFS